VPDWPRATRALTADRGGFDLIVELGGEQTLPLSLRAIRPGGTIALIGVLSGLKLDASLGPVVTRQVRLQGVTVGHREGFEAMAAAIAQHRLRPVIGHRFPFEALREALEHLRAGSGLGKTVIGF
jgi:NADPH:quinone reductase-like Zn-dependent oxidoreductase